MEKFEIINDYLKGKLSPEALEAFNKSIANDPNLKSMIDYEMELSQAITEKRIIDLKTKMNQIDISNSNTIDYTKIAASIVIIGGLSMASLYFINNTNTSEPKQIETKHDEKSENIRPEVKNIIVNSDSIKKVENILSKTKTTKITTPKSEGNSNNTSPIVAEHFIESESPSTFANENGTSQDANSVINPIINSKIEVIVNNHKSQVLRYKHINSKLYLDGNFDKKYEVIEINKKEIYLKYNNSIYNIKENIDILTPLEKISNPELIKNINKKLKELSN